MDRVELWLAGDPSLRDKVIENFAVAQANKLRGIVENTPPPPQPNRKQKAAE